MCVRACVRVCVRSCVWGGGASAQVCVCACVCCVGGTDGCIPLTMLVDVCRCPPFPYVCMLTAFETFPLL